jgi:hypothetical protein
MRGKSEKTRIEALGSADSRKILHAAKRLWKEPWHAAARDVRYPMQPQLSGRRAPSLFDAHLGVSLSR